MKAFLTILKTWEPFKVRLWPHNCFKATADCLRGFAHASERLRKDGDFIMKMLKCHGGKGGSRNERQRFSFCRLSWLPTFNAEVVAQRSQSGYIIASRCPYRMFCLSWMVEFRWTHSVFMILDFEDPLAIQPQNLGVKETCGGTHTPQYLGWNMCCLKNTSWIPWCAMMFSDLCLLCV